MFNNLVMDQHGWRNSGMRIMSKCMSRLNLSIADATWLLEFLKKETNMQLPNSIHQVLAEENRILESSLYCTHDLQVDIPMLRGHPMVKIPRDGVYRVYCIPLLQLVS